MTHIQIAQFLRSWYTLHSYPHAAAAVWQIISESDNPTKLVEKLKGMK